MLGAEKGQRLIFLNKIYHRADHPLHEYLHHCVTARNTRESSSPCELALVTPRCRTDQFRQSFPPVDVRMWNLLPSDVFGDGTLSSFKSAMNLCLERT